jgi:hypothetical protein
LKPEAATMVARPLARPQEIRTRALMAACLPVMKNCKARKKKCWQCGDMSHLRRNCQQRHDDEADQNSGKK